MREKFQLDKDKSVLFGVCAGIANHMRVDPTFVRIGVVVVTLLGAFPWTLLAYGLVAWLAKPRGVRSRIETGATSVHRAGITDIDRRYGDVEAQVVNANSSLAREIEELR